MFNADDIQELLIQGDESEIEEITAQCTLPEFRPTRNTELKTAFTKDNIPVDTDGEEEEISTSFSTEAYSDIRLELYLDFFFTFRTTKKTLVYFGLDLDLAPLEVCLSMGKEDLLQVQ